MTGAEIVSNLVVVVFTSGTVCFSTKIVSGIVCVAGYGLALIAMPSLEVSLFLWGLCCILDDIGWIYVYYKNRDKIKE